MLLLAGCAPDAHVPYFAKRPYEPFARSAAVAIALREWRLFGAAVEDADAPPHPRPPPDQRPEREQGLWQRVGEYWWLGMGAGTPDSGLTGKHDQAGQVFPGDEDGRFAWSAAFICYVMRMAGASGGFPYAPAHADYINAARRGLGVVRAEAPETYAPMPGDLICTGRGPARAMRFADLPTAGFFPAHCAIVVATAAGSLRVVGGNVRDSVELTQVPTTPDGRLAEADGTIVDPHTPWFVVIRILYAAE